MNYEKVKTIILTILIVLSAILTWNIWTFQPNYETMEIEKNVNEVAIGSKQEIRNIVKPHQVIFHTGAKQYGTNDNAELDKIMNLIGKWKYYDVRKWGDSRSVLLKSLSEGQYTELIFPDRVPVELYKKILNFEDQDLPKFEFDRMMINAKAGEGQEGTIYFYSTKSHESYVSNVSLAAISEFSEAFLQKANLYNPYFVHELDNKKSIYLPIYRTEMKRYTYYRNPIEPEQLKDALFRDPSFVQKSFVTEGEEFTDEASKMTVNHNTSMIIYVNPFRESEAVVGTENIIQKSIEHINGHSGWTDPFRFVYKDDFNQQVIFRMYSDEGYPIFNEIGLSEIIQEWGQTEIKHYVRPSFNLELPINPELQMVTMPSGEEIVSKIKDKTDLNLELLDDISLGYYMVKEGRDSSVISLEPGWFYQYDGIWFEFPLVEEERVYNGLE
ncbi:MAG: YycH family regulatory protein [Bacillota bacterium]